MTQALFFKPSFERLRERIGQAAPGLDVVLIDEQGRMSRAGEPVGVKDIEPEYFWIHAELFKSSLFRDYLAMIGNFPSARWLHTINTGLDTGPYLDLLRKGLVITNNHSQAIAIAEYVMAHVLSLFQDLPGYAQRQREKLWQYRPFREIGQSRWLIVGFGAIGQEVARRAKAFDVHITTARRNQDNEGLADAVCTLDNLLPALHRADVVILACASNPRTRDLVDAGFLDSMKAGAVLVNVARGDLVVEEDLKKALDAGKPGHAILDVFRQEPLPPEAWFWDHPNVSLTPHCSNGGSGMRGRSDELFLENLHRISNGQELLNRVSERDIV